MPVNIYREKPARPQRPCEDIYNGDIEFKKKSTLEKKTTDPEEPERYIGPAAN